MPSITDVVKHLLILNVLMYIRNDDPDGGLENFSGLVLSGI